MPETVGFRSSPRYDSNSLSFTWPSRYGPSNDGSCDQNVAVAVLEANDIPILGSYPSRGNLCAVDINNMPAVDAINFSLAENLADGKIIELYMNEDGFAYFQEVYPSPKVISLDIRTCVPTSNIDQAIDLVIVRGYDYPPVRYFKDFEELQWQEIECLGRYVPSYCQGELFNTEAWRAYKDPVLETQYKDGVENLYELNAFESLLGYIIKFEGVNDPDVKYSFSDTFVKNEEVSLGGWVPDYTFRCDESGGHDVFFMHQTHNLGNYIGVDKFGDEWPLLLNIQGVYLVGYQILSVFDLAYMGGGTGPVNVIIEEKPKLISLPTTNWHWELTSDSGALLHLYYPTDASDYINTAINRSNTKYVVMGRPYIRGLVGRADWNRSVATGGFFLNINGAAGVYVEKAIVAVELDRPSCTVHSTQGDAMDYLLDLSVSYAPIVVIDEPAPVAYNFGGGARLVDQTLDLYDSDPSTLQEPPSLVEGSLAWLQTQTSGRVVDITLPFADEDDCLQLANTIYEMQNESITQYNLVCGPSSEPELGAAVPGFYGRINKISYSYQDGSSYTINVNIGPTFIGQKGWGSSVWQRKTEDVQKEGIIVWCAGNGVDYRVKIQSFGVFPAVNKTLGTYSVGEKVRVCLHNFPQER